MVKSDRGGVDGELWYGKPPMQIRLGWNQTLQWHCEVWQWHRSKHGENVSFGGLLLKVRAFIRV